MRIALVHDYLREYGGAERVVEVWHEIWPQAPLYTAFVDWESLGKFGEKFKNWNIKTSWAQNFLMKKFHSPLRFLTPLVWESLNLDAYDLVISSSGWFMCRAVVTQPDTLHISYIHHPPRNLYGLPTGSSPNKLVQMYAKMINPFLRKYDFVVAQRPDYLIANSQATKLRIKKFYNRDAEVIYPPGPVVSHKPSNTRKKDYFLSVGRLNYAKRVDLAILACNQLQLPLKVVGTGSQAAKLKQLAGPTVEILGAVSDETLQKLYAGAKALIFTALEEDFGLVPVEAMSLGTPVIALRQGGVTETVVAGKTGIFFDQPTVESLIFAIKKFVKLFDTSDTHLHHKVQLACQNQAAKFSKEKFKQRFVKFVEEKYSNFISF